MATDVGSLRVLLGADITGFTRAMAKAKQSVDRTVSSMTAKLDALSGSLNSVGIGAAAAFAGLAIPIKKMVDAASDAEESLNLLSVTFGENTQEVLDWSKATSQAVGRSDSQMREFAGALGAVLVPMTGSAEAAQEMSTTFAQLAVDIGSFNNVADEDALGALRSGLTGETEPLKRFGIIMNQAALETFALTQGLGKSVKEMTEAEKVTLRYNFILSKTQNQQGDAARTLGGFANQVKATKAQMADLAEAQGRLFLPVAQKVVTAVRRLLAQMNNVSAESQRMKAALTVVAVGATAAAAAIGLIGSRVTSAISGLIKLGGAAASAALSMAPMLVTVGAIAAGVAGLIAIIGAARQAWEADLGGIRTALTEFKDDLDFEVIKTALVDVIDDITEKIVTATVFWRNAFDRFKGFFTGETFAQSFTDQVAEEAGAIIDEMRKEGGAAGALFDPTAAMETGKELGAAAADAISTSFEGGLDLLKGLKDVIPFDQLDGLIDKLRASGEEQLRRLADFIGIGRPGAAPVPQASAPPKGEAGGASASSASGTVTAQEALGELAAAGGKASGALAELVRAGEFTGKFFLELGFAVLKESKAFQRLVSATDELISALAEVVDAFGPLLDVLGDLVGVVSGAVKGAAGAIKGTLDAAGNFAKSATDKLFGWVGANDDLAEAAQEAARSVRTLVRAFSEQTDRLAQRLAGIALDPNSRALRVRGVTRPGEDPFQDELADLLRLAQFSNERQLGAIRDSLEGLRNNLEDQLAVALSTGDTGRAGELQSAIGRISSALDEGALTLEDTVDDMNASLTNVPRGFKLALARFNAISRMEPAMPGQSPTLPAPALANASGQRADRAIAIENFNIQGVSTIEEVVSILDSAKDASDFDSAANTGSGSPARASLPAEAFAAIPGLASQLNTGVP